MRKRKKKLDKAEKGYSIFASNSENLHIFSTLFSLRSTSSSPGVVAGNGSWNESWHCTRRELNHRKKKGWQKGDRRFFSFFFTCLFFSGRSGFRPFFMLLLAAMLRIHLHSAKVFTNSKWKNKYHRISGLNNLRAR